MLCKYAENMLMDWNKIKNRKQAYVMYGLSNGRNIDGCDAQDDTRKQSIGQGQTQ